MKIYRLLGLVACIVSLALFMGEKKILLAIQQLDNYTEGAGGVNINAGGVRVFSVGTSSTLDQSLRITQSSSTANGVNPTAIKISTNGSVAFNPAPGTSTNTATSVSIGRGYGGMFTLALSTASSAEIILYTPKMEGEIIYNATRKTVCVATGTAAGQFASIASTASLAAYGAGMMPTCWP